MDWRLALPQTERGDVKCGKEAGRKEGQAPNPCLAGVSMKHSTCLKKIFAIYLFSCSLILD